VQHPELPMENHVTHVEFYQPGAKPGDPIRNAVIIPPGAIDRSPCGTGTSAKCAVLAAKGLLRPGESFVHESIIGSRFTCQYLEDAQVCGAPAIIPRVTGQRMGDRDQHLYDCPGRSFPPGVSASVRWLSPIHGGYHK
jgi:proline racemase